MNDLLANWFYQKSQPGDNLFETSLELQQAHKQLDEKIAALKKGLTKEQDDVLCEITSAYSVLCLALQELSLQEGFRQGSKMMMEVLRPQSKINENFN